MPNTIFFSWQADTKTRSGRNFIERALTRAASRISEDTEVEEAVREGLTVDRDTMGVAGSPPIVETIFRKIDQAAVFVPDLTFTGKRLDGRPTPNPNVLVEYGWALKSLGYGRIVPVMNIAYGDPIADAMPFNMRHLHNPIAYHCPDDLDDSARKDVRDRLATEVEAAIRAVFDSDVFKESLPKMRDTEQGQLPAYMDVRPRKIGPTTTGDIVAHVTLVNSGQVPARRVGNNLKICWSADGNKKEFEPVEIENPEALLIIPGAKIVGGSQPLKPDEAAQHRVGRGYVYVWGRVAYSDGSGHDRWLIFCHRYNCAKPDELRRHHHHNDGN